MKKTIIFNLLLCIFAGTLGAQETIIYTHKDVLFEKGKELFNQRKYAASYRNFESFLKETEIVNAGQRQESEYYMAANAFELKQDDAEKQLKAYLFNHPYTPFQDNANKMLGMLEYENKEYAAALEYFNNVNDSRLGNRERIDFLFCKGYAALETKNYQQALGIFKELKDTKTKYNLSATYYYAYAEYTLKNYAVALPEFLRIEHTEEYKNIVPYYIIQIYYYQQNFDQLYERADLLLKNNPENKNNAEIYRIMGEIAYKKGDYLKTISYLKEYEKISPQVLRNDMYLLGFSYYQTKDYANTVKYLSKTTTETDELSENAYLHLGNSYIKLNDKNNARLAYEASLRTNFNKQTREEALYNYALTTYETTTAFGESISAFEQFINEFPNSKYINKVYDYLATVFMSTNSYEAAYTAIQKIKNPTTKLKEARQFLLYQIGTEAFTQNNLPKAIEHFTLSLQSSSTGNYSAESLFWRSEAYYRNNQPDESIKDLQAFFNNSKSKSSVNLKTANYSLAYAYFAKKSYSSALNWFLKYVSAEQNTSSLSYADAYNRIGDCYFNARDFSKAENYYSKAASLSPNTGDYAIFQSAYASGLQKNYLAKISRLENLITTYPRSEYYDDALYEIGRSYIMLENESKAISTFNRLLSTQPQSNLARKAAIEIGMIYLNQNNQNDAITAFKKVIADYPGTEESYTALESLESVYIERNDVASYLAYTKTLGMKISTNVSNREDSISYLAAERQYMTGKYQEAITGFKSYLKSFCSGGRYCTSAQYYLADAYYQSNDKNNALSAYQTLLQIAGNQFSKEATSRCAEITYDMKNYQSSLQYFNQLQVMAQNTEDKNIARLGILRCSYFLNDHQTTINIANEIITDSKSNNELISEARYNRAKAYIAINQTTQAQADLKSLGSDTRTANGAEAKYLLAKIYFDQNNLKSSETEILDFAKKGTPYQFWLAKSFILLSDIYIAQGNDFQAKQYLLSLQKNYTTADEIQVLINLRLNAIADRDSKTIIN
jgi:tetratricopeptide (TPR) repeat protein